MSVNNKYTFVVVKQHSNGDQEVKKITKSLKVVMCKMVLILLELTLKNLISMTLSHFVLVFENTEGNIWKILGK